MIAYILLFFYSSLMSVLYSIKRSWILFYLLVLPMVVLMGLRGVDVGIDTAQYVRNFHYSLSADYNKSFSFYIISRASYFFSLSYHGVFLLFSFFSVYPFFYVAKKEKVSLYFVVIFIFSMGIYFRYYNIMIQGMAVGLCFMSFYYRILGINKASFLVYAVALLTHYSAIFFLPFLLFIPSKKYSFLIFFLWIVSLPFLFSELPLLFLIDHISFVVPNAYNHYLSESHIRYDGLVSLGTAIPQVLFLFVWYAYHSSKILFFKRFGSYVFLFLFSVVIFNLLNSAIFFNRVHLYFTVFGVIAIPVSVNYLFCRYNRFFVNISVALFFNILFFYRLFQDPYLILPYSTSINLM